jgi:hypothetical protein
LQRGMEARAWLGSADREGAGRRRNPRRKPSRGSMEVAAADRRDMQVPASAGTRRQGEKMSAAAVSPGHREVVHMFV